jgi:5-methylcytosine-specific restriction protein A
MPYSAQKPCSYPGCSALVIHGRCKDHPYADAHDHESQRLYNTWRWKRIRKAQLAREPWCADCLRDEIYMAATEVDHIMPHRGDPIKFYTGPLQSLCKTCHSRKTSKEIDLGGAANKVFTRGAHSGRGQQREKISQRGESG